MCLATSLKAIKRLRRIKRRRTKPLALMARDIQIVRQYAKISAAEKLLTSPARPIVLLKRNGNYRG